MIEKFRRRLTLMVVSALLIIAVGIVGAINYANLANIRNQMYESLETLMENEGQRPGSPTDDDLREDMQPPEDAEGTPPPALDSEPKREDMPSGRRMGAPGQPGSAPLASLSNSYTIWLNEDGSVAEWTSDRQELYSDEQIEQLAAQIWSGGQTRGCVGSQFYQMQSRPNGAMLVVIDARSEMANIRTLLMETVAVTALAFLALALGAVLLIRRMIRPVEDAFTRQRQFVWDASHELKTPLAVISANADVLAGEIGENEYLGYIRSEVTRTNHLVENLLTLARMDKASQNVQMARFDLSRALLSVALPFESTVFEAGKRLEMDIPEGIVCRGNEEMVKQLVVILLSNALKYSDDGGVIRLSLAAKGNRRVVVVHNTGEPIPKEAQEHIFDRFYRVDASHNREKQGNGLGLAIAQQIVQQHRGKITVDNAPDRGTAFTVVLQA